MDPRHWSALADIPAHDQFKREGDLASEQLPIAGIYVLLAGDGSPLYVGQSGDIAARVRQHRRNRKRIFHTFEYYPLEDRLSRLRFEGILILLFMPPYNRALALGLGGEVCLWELRYDFRRKTVQDG